MADAELLKIPVFVHELIDRATQYNSGKLFVSDRQSSLTYSEFRVLGRRLSRYLRESCGLSWGDRLVCALENGVGVPLFSYAASVLGLIFVPISCELKGARLQNLLDDCSPGLIVTAKKIVHEYPSMMWRGLQELIITLEGFDEGMGDETEMIDEDVAILIYTSGSTGTPKGIALTHSNVLAATESISRYLGLTDSDRIINVNPFHFDYGLYQIFLTAIRCCSLFIEKDFTYQGSILGEIVNRKITVVPLVPSHIRSLFFRGRHNSLSACVGVRIVTSTGSPFPIHQLSSLRELFPNADVYSMYGLTECKRVAFLKPEKLERKSSSVGRPMMNVRCYLVDDQQNKIQEAGKVGQLVVEGRNLMAGYWNDLDQTVVRLVERSVNTPRRLSTGDYFVMDSERDLFFQGRRDDLVKVGDLRLNLKEIEAALEATGYVREAAVVDIDEDGVKELVAFVVPSAGHFDWAATRATLLREVESLRFLPKRVMQVDAMPRLTNGKTDYAELRNRGKRD